ncbi:MAG: type IV pilus twitching motility protein PilT [Proteobacteria bacterium]|nr:type IV pilus twitching motility protein PilT [Pseudomonadota bacterium]
MAEQKTLLMGRLAVQLKMITMEQLAEATAEQGRQPEKRLADIFAERGLMSAAQLQRLQKVQRDLIAKHRAKQALSGRTVAAPPRPKPPVPAAEVPSPARSAVPTSEVPVPAKATVPQPAVAQPASAPPAPPAAAQPASAPKAQPAAVVAAPASVAAHSSPDSLELTLAASADEARLHQILGDAVQAGASDIHIHAEAPLKLRVHGKMVETGGSLAAEETERLVVAALRPDEREALARHGELDLCYQVDGIGRFRTNVYRQQRGFDAVFRAIPAEPPTLEQLGLPSALAKFTNFHQGMVLITGPAGCGKSSTMAAMVNLINEERDEHILTVEDPIEYLHPSKRCLVNQRHAGRHTTSFARALRAALREDPDVIVIGELRDLETISLAMTAAETGHFVLATLHTNNSVRTINRMIGAFPSNEQDQVRTMLSESLRAVISQRLVAAKDGSGRVPALEILVLNKAIGNLIRDQKTVQIRSSIQTGASHGMCLLEQSLNELVRSGTVEKEEALRYAEEKKLITG